MRPESFHNSRVQTNLKTSHAGSFDQLMRVWSSEDKAASHTRFGNGEYVTIFDFGLKLTFWGLFICDDLF